MQQYQFEKIFSQMANEFGKIQKGKEDMYSLLLFTMKIRLPTADAFRKRLPWPYFVSKSGIRGKRFPPNLSEIRITDVWNMPC